MMDAAVAAVGAVGDSARWNSSELTGSGQRFVLRSGQRFVLRFVHVRSVVRRLSDRLSDPYCDPVSVEGSRPGSAGADR